MQSTGYPGLATVVEMGHLEQLAALENMVLLASLLLLIALTVIFCRGGSDRARMRHRLSRLRTRQRLRARYDSRATPATD